MSKSRKKNHHVDEKDLFRLKKRRKNTNVEDKCEHGFSKNSCKVCECPHGVLRQGCIKCVEESTCVHKLVTRQCSSCVDLTVLCPYCATVQKRVLLDAHILTNHTNCKVCGIIGTCSRYLGECCRSCAVVRDHSKRALTSQETIVYRLKTEFPDIELYYDSKVPNQTYSIERPEILVYCSWGALIIEIDENQHDGEKYRSSFEQISQEQRETLHSSTRGVHVDIRLNHKEFGRLRRICDAIGVDNFHVVRFNPDEWLDENGKKRTVTLNERLISLTSLLRECFEDGYSPPHKLSLTYLYYNGPFLQTDKIHVE